MCTRLYLLRIQSKHWGVNKDVVAARWLQQVDANVSVMWMYQLIWMYQSCECISVIVSVMWMYQSCECISWYECISHVNVSVMWMYQLMWMYQRDCITIAIICVSRPTFFYYLDYELPLLIFTIKKTVFSRCSLLHSFFLSCPKPSSVCS